MEAKDPEKKIPVDGNIMLREADNLGVEDEMMRCGRIGISGGDRVEDTSVWND